MKRKKTFVDRSYQRQREMRNKAQLTTGMFPYFFKKVKIKNLKKSFNLSLCLRFVPEPREGC